MDRAIPIHTNYSVTYNPDTENTTFQNLSNPLQTKGRMVATPPRNHRYPYIRHKISELEMSHLTSGGNVSRTFFKVTPAGTGSPIWVKPYSLASRCRSSGSCNGDGAATGAATADIRRLGPLFDLLTLLIRCASNCYIGPEHVSHNRGDR